MPRYIVEVFHGARIEGRLPHNPFSEALSARTAQEAAEQALTHCRNFHKVEPVQANVYLAVEEDQRTGRCLLEWLSRS